MQNVFTAAYAACEVVVGLLEPKRKWFEMEILLGGQAMQWVLSVATSITKK